MAFSIDLAINTKLYRSSKRLTDLSGMWYGLTPYETYGYGPITREFKLNTTVKLLNIGHNDFYNDYINKLNELSLSSNWIYL